MDCHRQPGARRAFFTATVVNNGQVLVAGGGTAAVRPWHRRAVQPRDANIHSHQQPNNRRADHTATLLKNGKVLLVAVLTWLERNSSAFRVRSYRTPPQEHSLLRGACMPNAAVDCRGLYSDPAGQRHGLVAGSPIRTVSFPPWNFTTPQPEHSPSQVA